VIRKDGSEYFAKNAQLFGMALQSRKGRFAFHDIHPQMRQCQCQDQASFNVNVAGLLRQMLRAKSLIINDVTGVAGFPDLHINLARFLLSEFAYYEYFVVIKSGWPSSFGEAGLPGLP
jgi:hypothetical protein